MTNLIDRGSTWLAGQLENSAGRTVTYRRGVGTSVALTATRMSEDEQAVDETGNYVVVRQHSFVFRLAALGFEPRGGDQLTETIGTEAVRWEVMPRAGGPAWNWEDAASIMVRVYVKQVN